MGTVVGVIVPRREGGLFGRLLAGHSLRELFGGEPERTPHRRAASQGTFALIRPAGLPSLKAQEAPSTRPLARWS
jgi:hypothetical protein